jgi:hypothetical protein
MVGKRSSRVLAITIFGLLVGVFGGGPVAQGAPVKELRVTVEPAVAADDWATDFIVTITNLGPSAQLGAVQITSPFSVNDVTGIDASGKMWTTPWQASDPDPDTIRLVANTLSDRLAPGQSVRVIVNATTPDINDEANNVDQFFPWLAEGRQANNFNDQQGGNEITQNKVATREGSFLFRDESGLTSTGLRTHEVLVRSGAAVDCGMGACTEDDTFEGTKVTVTVPGCMDGTLVVDAGFLFDGQVGAAAFYDYFGDCPEGTIVTVDIMFPKSLVNNAKALNYFAVYGKDIPGFDPNVPLPECGGSVTVNCVVKAATKGSNAQLKMLLTDPGAGAFR